MCMVVVGGEGGGGGGKRPKKKIKIFMVLATVKNFWGVGVFFFFLRKLFFSDVLSFVYVTT